MKLCENVIGDGSSAHFYRCRKYGRVGRKVCRQCSQNTTRVNGVPSWPEPDQHIVQISVNLATKPAQENLSPALVMLRPLSPVPIATLKMTAKLALRQIARRRRDGELGLGDTVARMVEGRGGNVFKRIYTRLTGKECGCADRQQRLNEMFPYSTNKEAVV